MPLRYGENPHQDGWICSLPGEGGVGAGRLVYGMPLSYNNYLDMDVAYRAVQALQKASCSIVKHSTLCGLAESEEPQKALLRALGADPIAAYGAVVAFNRPFDLATARAIKDKKLFIECIVAPSIDSEARQALEHRRRLRLFEAPLPSAKNALHLHRIQGGLLIQEGDTEESITTWQVVTTTPLRDAWYEELRFAMRAATMVRSNAIAVTRDGQLLGYAGGQTSRVDAVRQALSTAGAAARGAFLASDGFFPFPDSVALAASFGIAAIVHEGGSKRDADSIAACNDHGIAMVFTGRRHFRH